MNTKRIKWPMGIVTLVSLLYGIQLNVGQWEMWEWLALPINVDIPLWQRPWSLFTSHFIHGDYDHLEGNLTYFIPVAFFLAYNNFVWRKHLPITLLVVSTITVIIGQQGYHGGLSAVIFYCYVVAINMILRREKLSLVDLAFTTFVMFNIPLLVGGLLPQPGISNTGHLAGAIVALYHNDAIRARLKKVLLNTLD